MKYILTLLFIVLTSYLGVALLMRMNDNYEYNKCLQQTEQESLEKWEIYFRQTLPTHHN